MRTLLFVAAALLASSLSAQLVENHFPGKSEAEVAAEFEAGLGAFLTAQLKDNPLKPRMYAPAGRNETVYVQLTAVDGESGTWQTLVMSGWIPDLTRYGYDVYGKTYTFKHKECPTVEVAGWFRGRTIPPADLVALACWLAAKNDLPSANARLADLAERRTELRAYIETWICGKYGWKRPEGGLLMIEAINLEREHDDRLLLTKEAADARVKALDKPAKDELKAITKFDVKGKPGGRKTKPDMRLDMYVIYLERFIKCYEGTATLNNKRSRSDLDAVIAAVKADMDWINTEKFKAERHGIENRWAEASALYDKLLGADPHNHELMRLAAEARSKAAGISDAGRKAEDKAMAARAAALYEELSRMFPRELGFHNHAGLNWLASGDARKAKAHHQEVVRRTDNRSDLTDADKQNRAYAEGQLEVIK